MGREAEEEKDEEESNDEFVDSGMEEDYWVIGRRDSSILIYRFLYLLLLLVYLAFASGIPISM